MALLLGAALSVAVLASPALAAGLADRPALRLVIEVTGLFLAATAALVLALMERDDLGPARDAFLAALLVLAVTNAVFTVGPVVIGVRPSVDRGLAFYPWVAAQFVAGGLMLAAGLGRPRLGTTRTIGLAFVVLAVVDAALIVAGDRLPTPVVLTHDDAVEVISWVVAVPLLLIPAVLFAVGAALAARLHRSGGGPLYAWLSIAMTVQVFSQIHGLLSPAFLGPVITTMDVFRTGSWLLLAGGAVAELRHLYIVRSRTAERQAEDLRTQATILARQQQLAEREQDFRAVVSHELSTPVAAIRAFAHVVASPAAAEDQRRQALDDLRAEATRLAELVDRVHELRDLDVATPLVRPRPVAIRPLLGEVRAFASGLPGRSEVRLTADDARVLADPVRLGQLLRNLIANAARYSPAGAPIDVLGRSAGDERYEVWVIDRGPGIPAEERSHVFEPYARGSRTGDQPGFGLGLHIARRLAEAHGGELHLEDGPGGVGTCVRLVLRRAR